MKKLVLSLIFLLLLTATASAQVVVNRELPDSAVVGEEITVTLSVEIGNDKPAGAIIEESIPDGFTYLSSNPEATETDNTLKWVFYGSDLKDMEIKYTLKAEKSGKAEFKGTATTLLGVEDIGGDDSIEIVETEKAETKGAPGFEVLIAVIAISGALALRRN